MQNAEPFITETLKSILREHTVPIEIVVVNDKSTDGSLRKVEAIKDERVRVINGNGKGIAACFNVGLAQSRGRIIMRCDADDIYPPSRITKQFDWLGNNPNFGAICGVFAAINNKGTDVIPLNDYASSEEITDELHQGITRTSYCTFAVRREILEATQGMREYFITAEDIDLQLRIGGQCRVWFEPSIQYFYRMHDLSITHQQPSVEKDFFESTAHLFHDQRIQRGYDDLQAGNPPVPPKGNSRNITSATSQIQGLLLGKAWEAHKKGKKSEALRFGIRSLMYKPTDLSNWRNFIALLIKK